jgi:hypothetical protein
MRLCLFFEKRYRGGAVTEFVRFSPSPSPRIWFRCADGTTANCSGVESIACSHDWKALLPVWRTSETYLSLRNSHSNFERVHFHWRTRYCVAAATHEMRPKRIGLPWQKLRASGALLIEWLRILSRNGWMGSARRNNSRAKRTEAQQSVTSLLAPRLRNGLLNPYGPKAVELRARWTPGKRSASDRPGITRTRRPLLERDAPFQTRGSTKVPPGAGPSRA